MRVTEALIAGLLLVAAATVGSASGLRVAVPSGPVTVGDRVLLEVVAPGDAQGQGVTWDGLEIEAAAGEQEWAQEWAVIEPPRAAGPGRWELVLAPLVTGELTVPALVASGRDGAGRVLRAPAQESTAVVVSSVLPAGEEPPAPAPLASPVGAPGLPWEWALPAFLVLLPPAVLAAWWARRRRRPPLAAAAGAIAPLEELERLIAELESSLEQAPAPVVCDRLAHGLRCYVERRTTAPAVEMTTAELRALGRRQNWPEVARRGVGQALGTADAVRFARRPAEVATLRRTLHEAAAAAQALESALAPAEVERT